MVLVVLLCLLFVNMFVGVVIKTYNEEKEHISLNKLLETHERSWIDVQILTYQTKPVALVKSEDKNCLRSLSIKIT
jgi:hypothetical protein